MKRVTNEVLVESRRVSKQNIFFSKLGDTPLARNKSPTQSLQAKLSYLNVRKIQKFSMNKFEHDNYIKMQEEDVMFFKKQMEISQQQIQEVHQYIERMQYKAILLEQRILILSNQLNKIKIQ